MSESPVRRVLGWLVRPANPLSAVAPTERQASSEVGQALSIGRAALTDARLTDRDRRLAAIPDDAERFDAAMEAYGVGEDDLPAMERRARIRRDVMSCATVLAIAYAIVAPTAGLTGRSSLPWIDVLLPWAFVVPLLAETARSSLWLYQLRSRALAPVDRWLRQPTAWMAAVLAFLVGAAAMSPSSASAAGLGESLAWLTQSAGAQDLSMEWLRRLFPALTDLAGGRASEADPLKPMLQAFNSVLFFLSAAFVAWQTISALVYVAHTGKTMSEGSRYHATWAPIRLIIGIGCVIPVKGYCLAQLLVLQLLVGGYGLANGMYVAYVDHMLSPETATAIVGTRVDAGRNLIARVVHAETCAATVSLAYRDLQTTSGSGFWGTVTFGRFGDRRVRASIPPVEGVHTEGTDPTTGLPVAAQLWDYGQICGSMRTIVASSGQTAERGSAHLSEAEASAFRTFDAARVAALSRLVRSVRESRLPEDAARRSVPASGPAAMDMAERVMALPTAAMDYDRELTEAARTLVKDLNATSVAAFRRTARDLGWASAGALNFTLTRLSAAASDHVAGATPEILAPQLEQLSDDSRRMVSGALDGMAALVRASEMDGYIGNPAVQVPQDVQGWSPLARMLKVFTDSWARNAVDAFSLDTVRPMSSIMATGQNTLVAAESMYGIWLAMQVTAATAERATESPVGATSAPARAVTKALEASAPYVDMVVGGLLVFGALHAYVLPIVPFLLWFFAVLSVATLAVELVLVAPIAAWLHVRMDGDELVGQAQRTIYVMSLNAFLRPSLLLFGLVASNAMFGAMAHFLNRTFGVAMLSSQGNSIIGGVGVISFLLIVLYLHYQMAVRSMQLVHQIPAAISQMLGTNDQERGEEREGHTVIGGVTNMARSGGTQAVTRAFTPKRAGTPGPGGPGGPGGVDSAGADQAVAGGPGRGIRATDGDQGSTGPSGRTPRPPAAEAI